MYRRPISLSDPMAAQSLNLTVVDVYDLAASIGKEFETIIDNYGPEVVTELMPKVINVLEHLEILSTRNQKENAEINDLKYTIERLHAEKKSKAEERARFEEVSSELSAGQSCLSQEHLSRLGIPAGPFLPGIPILKMRWLWDRLIFSKGIPLPIRLHLHIETACTYTARHLGHHLSSQVMWQHHPARNSCHELWSHVDKYFYGKYQCMRKIVQWPLLLRKLTP